MLLYVLLYKVYIIVYVIYFAAASWNLSLVMAALSCSVAFLHGVNGQSMILRCLRRSALTSLQQPVQPPSDSLHYPLSLWRAVILRPPKNIIRMVSHAEYDKQHGGLCNVVPRACPLTPGVGFLRTFLDRCSMNAAGKCLRICSMALNS